MRRYLNQIPRDEAIKILISTFSSIWDEILVPVEETDGCITAKPVHAALTIPPHDVAGMDGIAIQSEDTRTATDQQPVFVEGRIVNTGELIPEKADAVIPFEELIFDEKKRYFVKNPARIGQNIRKRGSDFREGNHILPADHRIIPSDLGALLTAGCRNVPVKRIKIALIPTGDELIEPGNVPQDGQVIESNTRVIAAEIKEPAVVVRYPIIPDNPDHIRKEVEKAIDECHLVIICAGSSAGYRDHTVQVLESMGTLLFHGVSIKPGRSMMAARIKGTTVIGLPGYPVACQSAFREIVLPFLNAYGINNQNYPKIQATLSEPFPSEGGTDEYIPVLLARVNEHLIAYPRPRGISSQMAFVKGTGYLHIPVRREGYPQGYHAEITLQRSLHLADRQIVLAGEAHPCLDHLIVLMQETGYDLNIRKTSAAGAALTFSQGFCHGMILSGSLTSLDSSVLALIQVHAPGSLVSLTLGREDIGISSFQEIPEEEILRIKEIVLKSDGKCGIILKEKTTDEFTFRRMSADSSVIRAMKSGTARYGLCMASSAHNEGFFFSKVRSDPLCLIFRENTAESDMIMNMVTVMRSSEWKEETKEVAGFDSEDAGNLMTHVTDTS